MASLTTKDISLEQAEAVAAAAKNKAGAIGAKMDIAVVDAGGNLKAFARMDGAWRGSIDIAIRKARTARYFDMATGEIGKLSQPGGRSTHRALQRGADHVPGRRAAGGGRRGDRGGGGVGVDGGGRSRGGGGGVGGSLIPPAA